VNAFLASNACDRTGVAAIACARHGCYVPNTLVDLFLGEQQTNVDFAFLQAVKITRVDPEQGVMLIYDIVCQYIIYIWECIGAHLPAGLTIDQAIGLLHVHGHKDKCFFCYAPSFIPGSGIVAGEILKSLWLLRNSISPTVRTATLPHRAEMLMIIQINK
jgi:Kyakuja-Dileera-Zisupton transposase